MARRVGHWCHTCFPSCRHTSIDYPLIVPEQINTGEFIFRFYHILKNFTDRIAVDCTKFSTPNGFNHQIIRGIVWICANRFCIARVDSNVSVCSFIYRTTHTPTPTHPCTPILDGNCLQRVAARQMKSHTNRYRTQMMKIVILKGGFPVVLRNITLPLWVASCVWVHRFFEKFEMVNVECSRLQQTFRPKHIQ